MPSDAKSVVDEKLFGISSKILAGLLAIIFSVGGIMYTDSKQRMTTLEDRVSFLYQDKVSRAEFREEMQTLRMQNDANKSDIIARQDSLKSDVLARIDLLIPHINRQGK